MPRNERDALAAELGRIGMPVLMLVVARIMKKETISPADVDRFISTCNIQQLQTLLKIGCNIRQLQTLLEIARGIERLSDGKPTLH